VIVTRYVCTLLTLPGRISLGTMSTKPGVCPDPACGRPLVPVVAEVENEEDLTSNPVWSPAPVQPPTALDRQVGGSHYKMPIQHAEFCQRNRLSWCESAAIKYIVRHGRKNGVEDINKAIHYLEILKELEYPDVKNPDVVKK